MPLPSDAFADSVRSRLLAAAGKARHPDLVLWRFVADMDVLPDGDEISEDDVPAHEREPAELRRAALLVAAVDVVDRCIDDLQLIEFGDDQRPDAEVAADSFVYEWFPERHRSAYGEDFFRKVIGFRRSTAPGSSTPTPRLHRAHRSCMTCIRGSGQMMILRLSWLPASWTRRRR